MSFLAHLNAALQVTGPVVVILALGVIFKRIRLIDDHFLSVANRLVFNVCLPCLLFFSVSNADVQYLNASLLVFAVLATLMSVLVIRVISRFVVEPSKRGVFTQCAFRGNMAIMGLALCVNAFGDSVLPVAAMYVAVMTVLYNVITVCLLTTPGINTVINIGKNPLILAIVAGFLFSTFSIDLPDLVSGPINTLSKITLPLALLCIGGGLRLHSFRANGIEISVASIIKLVIQPAAICIAAVMLGFRGEALGVLFLMCATPTAAAAYVMSKQMSNHGEFAGEVITLTTLLSPITMTLGFVTLQAMSYL